MMRAFLAGLFAAALLPGCGTTAEYDSSEAELGGRGDYYSARQDFRKCIFPLCGGAWVKRVNQATTQCADGSYAEECYVAELDASAVSSDPEAASRANLFRGTISKKRYSGFGTFGVFKASESWVPGNADPLYVSSGTYYRVTDNERGDLMFHEAELNSRRQRDLSWVNLDGAGVPDTSDALSAIFNGSLLVQGVNEAELDGNVTLMASQFWLKYGKPSDCRATGCGPGDYCTFCWFAYSCIPENAIC